MIKVVIEKTLEDVWMTNQEAATLTDAEIIEICNEDLFYLLQNAKWKIEREVRK